MTPYKTNEANIPYSARQNNISNNIVQIADTCTHCVPIFPKCDLFFQVWPIFATLDARGLLVRQRRGASERVVLVGERPLVQAVKSFERADPISLQFISPVSKFDPGNLIGRLKKRFLKGLPLVKCAMILAKPVLPKNCSTDCRWNSLNCFSSTSRTWMYFSYFSNSRLHL